MVSSIAKRIEAMTNRDVMICDHIGQQRESPIWNGLHYIRQRGMDGAVIVNGPGARQYYGVMKDNRILWRKWDIAPGEIRLMDEERAWAVDQFAMKDQHPRFLLINPSWKAAGGGGQNKDWGFEKWQKVAAELKDVLLVQIGSGPLLNGVVHIETPTFRHACAILERSIGYVGHEGGLHHAAAALGKRAVVVFGGYISPDITGYANHKNLYVASDRYPLGCGTVAPCAHCRSAMDQITVEQVVSAVKEMVS